MPLKMLYLEAVISITLLVVSIYPCEAIDRAIETSISTDYFLTSIRSVMVLIPSIMSLPAKAYITELGN